MGKKIAKKFLFENEKPNKCDVEWIGAKTLLFNFGEMRSNRDIFLENFNSTIVLDGLLDTGGNLEGNSLP